MKVILNNNTDWILYDFIEMLNVNEYEVICLNVWTLKTEWMIDRN